MRILIVAPFGPGLLATSYARALERNGHKVFRFDSDRAYFQCTWYAGNRVARRLLRSRLWNRLNFCTIEMVRCVRPELVLAFKTPYLEPETVARIRTEEDTPIVNYYPDNPYCGIPLDPRKSSAQRRNLVEALREYTRVFTWERGLVKRLCSDGVSAVYLPFGVDPELFRPREGIGRAEEERQAVVFVGGCRKKRDAHMAAIRRHEVGLWGQGWTRASGRVLAQHVPHPRRAYGSSCAEIYSSADVCLNIVDDLNMPGHNMRTFEVPASGGVMLSTYTAEQAELFPEGEAAWYYRDPSEIDGILDRLRKDRATLERTRRAAVKIAREHDYRRRAAELVAEARR